MTSFLTSFHSPVQNILSHSHIFQYHGAHPWPDIRVLGPRPMQYDINPSGTTIGSNEVIL